MIFKPKARVNLIELNLRIIEQAFHYSIIKKRKDLKAIRLKSLIWETIKM